MGFLNESGEELVARLKVVKISNSGDIPLGVGIVIVSFGKHCALVPRDDREMRVYMIVVLCVVLMI